MPQTSSLPPGRCGAGPSGRACSARPPPLATLPVAKALALDLDGDMGLITETVASRDRLKSYDPIKLYGAERVADRDRSTCCPTACSPATT